VDKNPRFFWCSPHRPVESRELLVLIRTSIARNRHDRSTCIDDRKCSGEDCIRTASTEPGGYNQPRTGVVVNRYFHEVVEGRDTAWAYSSQPIEKLIFVNALLSGGKATGHRNHRHLESFCEVELITYISSKLKKGLMFFYSV
jgi:hypothetical protein